MLSEDRFYTCVEGCLGGGWLPGELALEEAARTTHVILHILARRLSHDERLRIASGLPRRLAVELANAESGPEDQPIAHVAEELGLDEPSAVRRVVCVVETL